MQLNIISGGGSTGSRVEYIDCLRGMTMLLVVYMHFFGCDMRYTGEWHDDPICCAMGHLRMPMFFFLSGLFASHIDVTLNWAKEKIGKRFRTQFIPSVVLGVYYCRFMMKFSIQSFLFSNNRESPCWFTITLFEFFVAYCAVAYVLTRLRCGLRTKTIVFTFPIIVACLLFPYLNEHGFDHTRPTVWAAIGLYEGVNFVSYFCLGVICKLWWPQFIRLVDGRWTSLVCAALFLPFCLYYDIPLHLQLLLSTVSVVMVYSFFHRHPALFCSQTFIGRSLLLFGRHTLAIFLLHWYFILNLRWIHYREWGSFCNEYWFTRLAICLCAAVLISLACIAVSKVWHWAIRVASARGRSFLRLPANER